MDADDELDDALDFNNLIAAIDALSLLEPHMGGSFAAKTEIADRMRDGRLSVYARRAWDSQKLDVRAAWKEMPDEADPERDFLSDFEVGSHVFQRSRSWTLDQASWRWPSGRFSTLIRRQQPALRYMLEDVHFDPDEIDALVGMLTHRQVNDNVPPISIDDERNDKNEGKRQGRPSEV